MNQIEAFNDTLEYFERTLGSEIDERQVLFLSGYSYPLFARVFSIMLNMTLSDYLRYRKLTRAAIELSSSDEKIVDIAMKYGYESHNSFTTAFKKFHNVTPSDVRKGHKYKVFSPVHFTLNIEGGNKVDIKIEKKKAFAIAGISMKSNKQEDFPKLWGALIEGKGMDFLRRIGNGQSYGACFDFKDKEDFSYMAGFDVTNEELARSKGLEILEVLEADYAIIPLKGKVPDCIHRGWKYVVGTFLPENELKHAGAPDFEVYGNGDMTSDDYEMHLWVPVEKA